MERYLDKPKHGVRVGLVLSLRDDGRDSVDFPGETLPFENLMTVGGMEQVGVSRRRGRNGKWDWYV